MSRPSCTPTCRPAGCSSPTTRACGCTSGRAASRIAAGYDMLRVDFYEHDGVLWFGELTPYPGAGLSRLEAELGWLLGSWWTLPVARRLLPRGSPGGPG